MAEPHMSAWGVAKILGTTLVAAISWHYIRYVTKVDRIEASVSSLVTRDVLDERIDKLRKEVNENTSSSRDGIISQLDSGLSHINNRLDLILNDSEYRDILIKKKFRKLKHGFVGYIDDDDT